MRKLALLATCLCLTACGQSGDLYRPEDRPPPDRAEPQDLREALERQDAADTAPAPDGDPAPLDTDP